jgi:hypothetical protein
MKGIAVGAHGQPAPCCLPHSRQLGSEGGAHQLRVAQLSQGSHTQGARLKDLCAHHKWRTRGW